MKRQEKNDGGSQGAGPIAADDQLVTTEEAAQILRVKVRTLEAWRRQRLHLPWVLSGPRRVVYKLTDLRAFIAKQTVTVGS